MPSCSVVSCSNNNCRTKSNVKYYRFPKEEEYCIKWYLACGKEFINLKFATVCSQHFDPSATQRTKQQELLNYSPKCYRGLKPNAIPTKNIPWDGVCTKIITPKVLDNIKEWCSPKVKIIQDKIETTWQISGVIGSNNSLLGRNYVVVQPAPHMNEKVNTSLSGASKLPVPILPNLSKLDTLESSGMTLLKSEFKDLPQTISNLRGEIGVWQKQYTELKQCYEALVKDHKSSLVNRKKEVDLAVHAVLSGIFTPGQIKMLLNRGAESKNRKLGIHWTHRDMKTALTLRNLSPRAYHYLRSDMNYPLPAPSSLRRFKFIVSRKIEKNLKQSLESQSNGTEVDTLSTLSEKCLPDTASGTNNFFLDENFSFSKVSDNHQPLKRYSDNGSPQVVCVLDHCDSEVTSSLRNTHDFTAKEIN